jgi:hypothetical protein
MAHGWYYGAFSFVMLFAVGPIAGLPSLFDSLAVRGVFADRCGGGAGARCHAQIQALETWTDVALSTCCGASVFGGVIFDIIGGRRAAVLFAAVMLASVAVSGVNPGSGAWWSAGVVSFAGSGAALVMANLLHHLRRVCPGDARYPVWNAFFTMLYSAASVVDLALAKWLAWAAVPLWLSYLLLAGATSLPALAVFALPVWARPASAVETAPLLKDGAVQGAAAGASSSSSDDGGGDGDGDLAMADETVSLRRVAVSARALRGIAVQPVYWALCGYTACAITLSCFVLATIGSLMAHHGADAAQVTTSRDVATVLVCCVSPFSLVPGFLLSRLGTRRGIIAGALLSAGIIGFVVVLYAATTVFGLGFEWQYVTLAAVLVWRVVGLGLLNTAVPMLFGTTHADGVGAALGGMATMAGVVSMVFAAVITQMVHARPAAFTGVMIGAGSLSCVAQVALAVVAYQRIEAPRWAPHEEERLQ